MIPQSKVAREPERDGSIESKKNELSVVFSSSSSCSLDSWLLPSSMTTTCSSRATYTLFVSQHRIFGLPFCRRRKRISQTRLHALDFRVFHRSSILNESRESPKRPGNPLDGFGAPWNKLDAEVMYAFYDPINTVFPHFGNVGGIMGAHVTALAEYRPYPLPLFV